MRGKIRQVYSERFHWVFRIQQIRRKLAEEMFDSPNEEFALGPARNALGGPLKICCQSPVTGFFRNGRCDTCAEDVGSHTVCAEMTEEFLEFSAVVGNDLSTPRPEFGFPGLKPGDRWCLCAARWKQADEAGFAPPVILGATHEAALEIVALEDLQRHSTA